MNPLQGQIDLAHEAAFPLSAIDVRPATREIFSGEKREVLEPKIMQVLVALARRRNEVVSRDDLIARCWGGRAVSDDAINRCIGRIRRLAETHGGFELETIPRVGYRLTETSSDPSGTKEAAPGPSRPGFRRPLVIAVAVALVIVILGAAYWFRQQAKVLVVEAPVRHLIAVLPFSPLSADPGNRFYGEAAATAVAQTLSKIGQPVIPTSQSFQFRGAAKAQAAKALQAMYVIDGDVLCENGRVRISVRLDDSIRGTTIFARTFDEPAERAPALPDRVAAYIAALSWGADITAWDSRLAPAVLRAFEQQQRGDLYAAYVTARELALAEPDNADVQRIYASDTINLIYASLAKRKLSLIADARAAAEKALRLRPGSGEANAVLASVTPHFFWGVREGYLRKALVTNPDSVGVAEYLTWLLDDAGRFREAEPWARMAYERFPYHTVSYQRQTEQLLGTGNAAAALEIIPSARRLWPDDALFVTLNFEATAFYGAPDAAEALLKSPAILKQLPANTVTFWSDITRALRSRRPADIAQVARACTKPAENWSSCMIALSMLGRLDEAFRIADAAYPDQRAPTPDAVMAKWLANSELPLTRYLFLPGTAPMRTDPRFRDIAERTGLLQYWQSTDRGPDFCATEKAPVCRLLKPS